MKRVVLGMLAASVAAWILTLPAVAQSDQQPSREEHMRHWAADRETALHAKLADTKTRLSLRPEQENLWTAFESAITSAFKSHTEAQTAVSDAARPLYESLDDTQKGKFKRSMSEREPAPPSDKRSVEGYYEPGSAGFGWFPDGWFGPKPPFR